MTLPGLDRDFPRTWSAEVLAQRPLILPERHYVYPNDADEVERGALEVMVFPEARSEGSRVSSFLATCALGFKGDSVPTGVWATPNPAWMCAVSGGYAYLIDTVEPEKFEMVECRPVLDILPVVTAGVLLFLGHHHMVAWGARGKAWQSPRLSWEGLTIDGVDCGAERRLVRGRGWDLMTDRDVSFVVDLETGERAD